jgi:hypothetical protein
VAHQDAVLAGRLGERAAVTQLGLAVADDRTETQGLNLKARPLSAQLPQLRLERGSCPCWLN